VATERQILPAFPRLKRPELNTSKQWTRSSKCAARIQAGTHGHTDGVCDRQGHIACFIPTGFQQLRMVCPAESLMHFLLQLKEEFRRCGFTLIESICHTFFRE
jgi:hypothetical protein